MGGHALLGQPGRAAPSRPRVRATRVTAPEVLSASSSTRVSSQVRSGFEAARASWTPPTIHAGCEVATARCATGSDANEGRARDATRWSIQSSADPPACHPAQDGVGEPGGSLVDRLAGQLDGLPHGGVVADAHVVQLVHAQAQRVEQLGLQRVQPPVHAVGQDRIVATAPAQRPVAELGGEARVPAGQPVMGQDPRPGDVRVRPVELHGAEQVEGRQPGGIHPRLPAGLRGRLGGRAALGGGLSATGTVAVPGVSQGARPAPRARRGPSPRPPSASCPRP